LLAPKKIQLGINGSVFIYMRAPKRFSEGVAVGLIVRPGSVGGAPPYKTKMMRPSRALRSERSKLCPQEIVDNVDNAEMEDG
jgi:hypothetical protein